MPKPGDYLPDSSEGIDDVDDLPKPLVKKQSKIQVKCPCPHCGCHCRKHRKGHRKLRHLGNRSKGRPVLIELAIRVVVEDGLSYREASWHLWRDRRVFVHFATIQNRVEAAGKKRRLLVETDDDLAIALEKFSGYIAVDEVYDGPFCILSIVDNREFLNSFKNILAHRGLELHGITTDGSNLHPEPIETVFPGRKFAANLKNEDETNQAWTSDGGGRQADGQEERTDSSKNYGVV